MEIRPGQAPPGCGRQLDETGRDLCNAFATIPRRQRELIAQRLAELVPVIADVDARLSSPGQHRSVFQDRWNSKVWYEPSEVSDGTMLVLAFLVAMYQPVTPQIIAIEEPERGLHPYLIGEIVSVLRGLSVGAGGSPPVQVILATHSPQLLEFAKPEEVRFLTRQGEDIVVREPPTPTTEWEQAFREYEQSLGSVWLSGSLGGVPGAAT